MEPLESNQRQLALDINECCRPDYWPICTFEIKSEPEFALRMCGIPHHMTSNTAAVQGWGRQICTIRMKLFSLHYHIGEGWRGEVVEYLPPPSPSPHKHHNVNFVSATMFSGAAPAMATHFIRDNSFERLLNWTFSWLFNVIMTVFAIFESTHKIRSNWIAEVLLGCSSWPHFWLINKNCCPDNWYLEPIVFPMFPHPPCLHPSTGLELDREGVNEFLRNYKTVF